MIQIPAVPSSSSTTTWGNVGSLAVNYFYKIICVLQSLKCASDVKMKYQ